MLQSRQEVKKVQNEQTKKIEEVLTRRPQEWISNFKDAVKGSIYFYLERNRCLPERIIVYRDGVGESFFLKVSLYYFFFLLYFAEITVFC